MKKFFARIFKREPKVNGAEVAYNSEEKFK